MILDTNKNRTIIDGKLILEQNCTNITETPAVTGPSTKTVLGDMKKSNPVFGIVFGIATSIFFIAIKNLKEALSNYLNSRSWAQVVE